MKKMCGICFNNKTSKREEKEKYTEILPFKHSQMNMINCS